MRLQPQYTEDSVTTVNPETRRFHEMIQQAADTVTFEGFRQEVEQNVAREVEGYAMARARSLALD